MKGVFFFGILKIKWWRDVSHDQGFYFCFTFSGIFSVMDWVNDILFSLFNLLKVVLLWSKIHLNILLCVVCNPLTVDVIQNFLGTLQFQCIVEKCLFLMFFVHWVPFNQSNDFKSKYGSL